MPSSVDVSACYVWYIIYQIGISSLQHHSLVCAFWIHPQSPYYSLFLVCRQNILQKLCCHKTAIYILPYTRYLPIWKWAVSPGHMPDILLSIWSVPDYGIHTVPPHRSQLLETAFRFPVYRPVSIRINHQDILLPVCPDTTADIC